MLLFDFNVDYFAINPRFSFLPRQQLAYGPFLRNHPGDEDDLGSSWRGSDRDVRVRLDATCLMELAGAACKLKSNERTASRGAVIFVNESK